MACGVVHPPCTARSSTPPELPQLELEDATPLQLEGMPLSTTPGQAHEVPTMSNEVLQSKVSGAEGGRACRSADVSGHTTPLLSHLPQQADLFESHAQCVLSAIDVNSLSERSLTLLRALLGRFQGGWVGRQVSL